MICPICPYCGQPSEHVTGAIIYPRHPDLHDREYFHCAPCDAWVGTHKDSGMALGRLANKALRQAKQRAHAAFDPLWQKRQRISGISQSKARGRGYKWLAKELGISPKACHIGMMDEATCNRVVEICRKEKA